MITELLQVVEGYGKLTLQELNLIKQTPKAASRFAKCVDCIHLDGAGKCDFCGCLMKAKVLARKSFCPKGKW